MRLTAFFCADHAEAVNGKLYVTGGCWNALNVAQLPTAYHHLSVCIALEVPWEETGRPHAFDVRLVDADGRDMLPQSFAGQIDTARPPEMRAGESLAVVMVLNLNNMTLTQDGHHEFVMTVDGNPLGRARFRVNVMQPPGSPSQDMPGHYI
ncbi:MAG TPA: hypothetical protein VM840_12970 [Actinomycetota bacterium]|nr:hypothetical protein [Actinomycetota bacterium]